MRKLPLDYNDLTGHTFLIKYLESEYLETESSIREFARDNEIIDVAEHAKPDDCERFIISRLLPNHGIVQVFDSANRQDQINYA